jgi:hypothetical protein
MTVSTRNMSLQSMIDIKCCVMTDIFRLLMEPIGFPETSLAIGQSPSLKSQKNEFLIYTAKEAWNDA